jgi:hypothetical protein
MGRLVRGDWVCTRAEITPAHLRKLVERGLVPHIRLAERTCRYDVDEIERWIAERAVPVAGRKVKR